MTENEKHVYAIAAKGVGYLAASATMFSHEKGLEAHRKLGDKLWRQAMKADEALRKSFPDEVWSVTIR